MDDTISNGNAEFAAVEPSQEVNLDGLYNQIVQSENPPEVQSQEDEMKVEINPKYAHLPEEQAVFRTLQSERDSFRARLEKEIQSKAELEQIAEIFETLYNDDSALEAFLAERKPELVSKRDYSSMIKSALAKEFGEEFRPTLTREEAERDDPGGQDALYYLRLDEIRKSIIKPQGENPKSLKEWREKQKQKADIESQKVVAEIKEVQKKYNLSDSEVEATLELGRKMNFESLYKTRKLLLRLGKPMEAGVNLQPTQNINSNAERFVKELFGKNAKVRS